MEYSYGERLIGIENLTVQFGDKVILKDVNANILNVIRPGMHQGQVVALLGPSGCGKTQLFRCIAGLNRPNSGKVVLRDSTQPVLPGQVGMVQQAYPLLPHRTVLGNLLMAKAATREKALELLVRFDLLSKKDNYPVELSGGQRQRIAIIQQLLMDNHFLLMDEPFSGLDVISKTNVCEVIQEVTRIDEDNTVIFSTHDIETALTISDTVWIIGKVKDEKGNSIGASIVKTYDLIKEGLAWRENISKMPRFFEISNEIKDLFKTLI